MNGTSLQLGLVVGRDETWSFIRDLYEDWQRHYRVDVFEERPTRSPFFKERLNRRGLQRGLSDFLASHDVVFFEWASELLAISSHLPKQTRIATRLHRYEMYQWADRIQWDVIDTIILVSEAKRREFLSRFPAQAAKCAVVPVGVDLERFAFRPKPAEGRLGTLCHLSPRKRVYELILSFSELARHDPAMSLRIGGGPAPGHADYLATLHSLVARLGLPDRVLFDGPVEDTGAWFDSVDVFLSNSTSEGLQVAPMEAMAAGCYVLSHRWEGADELLPEGNLYWTDEECRRLVRAYLSLPADKQQRRMAAMREIAEEKFDSRATADRVRALIEGDRTVA